MNTDEQIVWKVVRKPESVVETYESVVSGLVHNIKYKVNKFVKSSLPCSKIFCFKTRKDARRFKKQDISEHAHKNYLIFKCIGRNVTLAKKRSLVSNILIEDFWQGKMDEYEMYDVPIGTLFCDELMLVEKAK